MKYDDMPAGPELDRLVAEKAMGWRYEVGRWWAGDRVAAWCAWSPSTEIAHAWGVVERMRTEWMVSVAYGTAWVCSGQLGDMTFRAEGDTAPLAICRAALSALP